jgi:allophanate hydrolase
MVDRAEDRIEGVIERRRARPELNVWTHLTPDDDLRDEARRLDVAARDGTGDGPERPLAGVPFAVKDNIDVAGIPTTAGCREFAYTPERSAPVVDQLLRAGALFVGKTNLDQFATGLVGTRSPDFGICRNPFNPEYIAGGSSSGSAVAVTTGMVALALGTDTAGSGRVPAACCGIVGTKPTRGLVSTQGVVPASRSFDCVSWFTRSTAEAARALAVTTANAIAPSSTPVPTRIRVGIPHELYWFGDVDAPELFETAVVALSNAGVEILPVDIAGFIDAGKLLYGTALAAERAAAFGAFAEAHPAEMDPTVLAVVREAARYDATDVFRALEQLDHSRTLTAPTWRRIDAIVVPTVARLPRVADVLQDPFGPNAELGTYTSFVNLLDLCAVAAPAGRRANGLPFGVSLVAPPASEHLLLALAAHLGNEDPPPGPRWTRLAVVGSHLSGHALNHQLLDRGARLVSTTTTAPVYRLFDLGTTPARPGMIREPSGGAEIAVELWELEPAGLGAFVAGVPSPLVIGSVELVDGSTVLGFLCEPHALSGARDITAFGGWRAYREARA